MKSTVYGLLAMAVAFGGPVSCQAGAVTGTPTQFSVSGLFADRTSLSGTITIDTTLGTVTAGDLFVAAIPSAPDGGNVGTLIFSGIEFDSLIGAGSFFAQSPNNAYVNIDFHSTAFPSANLLLDINLGGVTSLLNFDGDLLCDSGGACGSFQSFYTTSPPPVPGQFSAELPAGDTFLTSGSIAGTGAPEPASFLLLLAPAALIAKKRYNTAR